MSHWAYEQQNTSLGLERVLPGLSLSGRSAAHDSPEWHSTRHNRHTPPGSVGGPFDLSLKPVRSPPNNHHRAEPKVDSKVDPRVEPKVLATPARPTRQPPKSKYALWVGNLPAKPTLAELCGLFGSMDMISVYLIHRTGCAFVNYSSGEALDEAVRLFGARGGKIRDHALVIKTQKKASPLGSPRLECPPAFDGDRYFICKSLTLEDLEAAKRTGKWCTQAHNRDKFNSAFRTSKNVYFIFSANRTSSFYGYARMASLFPDQLLEPVAAQPKADDPHVVPVPAYSDASVQYPAGNIVEDTTRGCLFWEALGHESVQDDASHWTAPCEIEWKSNDLQLLFSRTRQMRNPFNSNKPVKVARDGTEIEPATGKQLLELFD